MPPSAMTVWALPSSDLQTTPTERPAAMPATAARRPAPPAPMMRMSWGWLSIMRLQEAPDDRRARCR